MILLPDSALTLVTRITWALACDKLREKDKFMQKPTPRGPKPRDPKAPTVKQNDPSAAKNMAQRAARAQREPQTKEPK